MNPSFFDEMIFILQKIINHSMILELILNVINHQHNLLNHHPNYSQNDDIIF